mgnify:FL=1
MEKKIIVDDKKIILTDDLINVDGRDMNNTSTCSSCDGDIEDGDILSSAEIINPENEQKIDGNAVSHEECVQDSDTERWFGGGEHCDWPQNSKIVKILEKNTDEDGDTDYVSAKKEIKKIWKESGLTHSVYTFEELFEKFIII